MLWTPRRRLRFHLLPILGTGLLWAGGQKVDQAVAEIRVKIYDAGLISPPVLVQAKDCAATIFRKARIRITWEAGLMRSDVTDRLSVDKRNGVYLQLRIWKRSQAGSRVIDPNLLGFSLSIERGDAVLLWDQIVEMASLDFVDPGDLLGLAMAHEMGHLLLRLEGHSTSGIMRAHFPRELRDDTTRTFLVFSREQRKLMRQEIWRREQAINDQR